MPGPDGEPPAGFKALVRASFTSLRDGIRILFKGDPVVRSSLLFSLGLVLVMGGYQGIVLPAHFTATGDSALLGVMLSALSAGLLAGSLVYSAATRLLSRRAWYVVSLMGMLAGIAVVGLLPPTPVMLGGCFLLGLGAGPLSALLGFLVLDRIPDDRRGAAMGTQNTLVLMASPVAAFFASVLIEVLSLRTASLMLVGVWALVTVVALTMRGMRKLD